jgi:hypothetical protein
MAGEKGQRDLARGRAMRGRDLRQDLASGAAQARKAPMPEGAVSGDGDAVPLAPWQHGVFDGPLLEMIEDLIAGDAFFPCDRQVSLRSRTSKLLTPQDRILPLRRSSSNPAIVSASL